jgi:xanthine dehydrogenase YagR molybdenum-binding subunit
MSDFPTGGEIIDQNRGGLIGKPVDRVDGWAKVTGAALYAYETQEAGDALVGVMVGSTIPAGKITAIDNAAAEAAPGVVLVLTHANTPLEQAAFGEPKEAPNGLYTAKPVLASDQVRFYGDPVALVVADSFENARAAAALVQVTYDRAPAELSFEDRLWSAEKASPTAYADKGDFDAAFAAAPVQIDAAYVTPIENHAQMEPHATLAVWEGEGDDERLHLFTSHQILKAAQTSVAATFKLPAKRVRVVSRFIGGGFGGKLHVGPDIILAAQAAKALGRPVKVALTRQQMFSASTHRTASRQRIRLGADRDGRLTAIGHDGIIHCARFDHFVESVGAQTKTLYAAPNRRIRHDLVHLDLPMAHAVRAPGEAIGMLALEAAMDELAEATGLDPIALRVINEPTVDPDSGKPYGSRSLLACMREGAARFGWDRRSAKPGLVRDGRWLVGLGMSAAIRSNYLVPSKATLGLAADGTATVRQAMTDIGTGTYTILAQIAAEALGLAIGQVKVEIGDSDYPAAPGSGGSFGAASAGSALLEAAMTLRQQIAALAVGDQASPLAGGRAEDVVFADGAVFIGNRSERLTDVLARNAPGGLETHSAMTPPKKYGDYSQHAHGAHFAEVGVDPLTGEVRLRRMLGVFAAGRILNAKTARSQALGGMIWGVGQTLTEENHVDARFGSFVAQDLASYHVPAHADIVDLDAVFIAEQDDHGNPLKIKGVGELGICGAGASVANAIYNACGVRLRDYPMTLDKVLAGMTG